MINNIAIVQVGVQDSDVSSANSLTLHFKPTAGSFISTRKNKGPRIEPWGTPAEIPPQLELCPFRFILYHYHCCSFIGVDNVSYRIQVYCASVVYSDESAT